MLPIQSSVEEHIEAIPEVTAESFLSGLYDQTFWLRAKYRCAHCLKFHVALSDGAVSADRALPSEFTATCELTKKRILVKAWDPANFKAAAKKVAASVGSKLQRSFRKSPRKKDSR
jgi:hypothetical protein